MANEVVTDITGGTTGEPDNYHRATVMYGKQGIYFNGDTYRLNNDDYSEINTARSGDYTGWT